MNYENKYQHFRQILDEDHGIFRGFSKTPCKVCGRMTSFIELNYEMSVCSEECLAQYEEDMSIRLEEFFVDVTDDEFIDLLQPADGGLM